MIDRYEGKFHIDSNDMGVPLWRYMDLPKFLDILENKKIFFPKVELFEDKYEGIHNAIGDEDFYDITNHGKLIRTESITDARHEKNSDDLKRYLQGWVDTIREAVGVSCWRLSEHESHAMWKIFLNSNEGVAIKTSITSLTNGLGKTRDKQQLMIGKVQYINYQIDKIPIDNIMNSLFYKNIYFEHEKELRVIVYEQNEEDLTDFGISLKKVSSGILVEFNYKEIIEEILISPYAPSWFYDLVCKVCNERYALDVPIKNSIIGLK